MTEPGDVVACTRDGCEGYVGAVGGMRTVVCPLVQAGIVYLLDRNSIIHDGPQPCPLMAPLAT